MDVNDTPRVSLPVLRGTSEGAKCEECPLSIGGLPSKPVYSEYPEDPFWLLIGEGPGRTEVQLKSPFRGASGQAVEKMLARVGRPRDQIYIGNATLCIPPYGAPVDVREKAAVACKPRMLRELAQFPGKPILTLGAVAARSVIPKATLDAIDPPDVPKSKKKAQKDRQKAERKAVEKRKESILKIAKRRYKTERKRMMGALSRKLTRSIGRVSRRPALNYLEQEADRIKPQVFPKILKDAEAEYEQKKIERELKRQADKVNKPKKKKPIKITDIMSACFDVDVDGSGSRPVIPAIHPAALLRGGGAMIAGTHAPDLGFVNLIYDALKVDSLARGKDIRLHFAVELEYENSEKAISLFLGVFWEAMAEGAVAIDLETYVDDDERHHALMAYMAKIRAIGFATKHRSVSVLWDLLPDWCQTYLQVLLSSCEVIAHNGLYDRTVLRAYGFVLNEIWSDSLLAHHAAFPGCAHRLQQVTCQLFAVPPWKAEFRNAEETPEGLTRYNAIDTGSTRQILHPLQLLIKKNQVEKSYARDLKMSEIASRMHLDGMPVSREVNAELLSTFTTLSIEARQVVEDKARDPALRDTIKHHIALQQALKQRKADTPVFEERYTARLDELRNDRNWRWNIGSGEHIAGLLQAIGVSLSTKTESGKTSTKKEILEGLADIAIVRDILKYRENDKMRSTFIAPIFDRVVQGQLIPGFADGNDRIHPIWSIHKISGRWASSEPVMSNPPKDKVKVVDGKEILERPSTKRQIIAPKGRGFVGFDLAQLEARIIALISGDPFLLDVFATGKDIHTECARIVFDGQQGSVSFDAAGDGSKRSAAQKRMRDVTKNFEYCLIPGTRVLASDLTWRGIETLKLGDELIGFSASEPGKHWEENYFQPSMVKKTKPLRQLCYRIVTTEGEVIASAQHLWIGRMRRRLGDLIRKTHRGKSWIRTDQLQVGDILAFTAKPWAEDRSWEAGYLAGIYDGEGWIADQNVGFAQNRGDVLELVKRLLKTKEFQWRATTDEKCVKTTIKGGLWEGLRFLGSIKPRRLYQKSNQLWKGSRLRGKGGGAHVLAIECVDEQEVIAVETSTQTFIAEGFLSHNCTFYGGSPETSWKTLLKDGYNVRLADVTMSVNKLKAKCAGVTRWQADTVRKASSPPYELRDFVDGRRRVWPMGQVDMNEALNIVPQATGAAIMNTGLERMDARLKNYKQAFTIVQVHDAAVFECWEDDMEKIQADVDECFPQEYESNGRVIPFPIESSIGHCWKDV